MEMPYYFGWLILSVLSEEGINFLDDLCTIELQNVLT